MAGTSSSKITFGLVGAGWRSEFYLRIAEAAPERFEICGAVVRDAEKGRVFQETWGVRAFRTVDELLRAAEPAFMVVSVPWAACPDMIRLLAERGVPVLSETPPAPDLAGLLSLVPLMERGAKVQVAEQYPFQPMHAARQKVADSGKLGTVSQVQMSAAHGYHGVALLRRLLGNRFEPAQISAYTFESDLVAGPGRQGPPQEHKIVRSRQTVATLRYENGKLGVFDFTSDQYFSWIRSPRILVRGESGEIVNTQLSYLENFQTPVKVELRREDAGRDGNLEGYYHKGILAGSEWVYRNPLAPARLSDDEIAVATCLIRMAEYARGGPSFYGLAEACQDHYVSLLIGQAAESGETLTSTQQAWCRFREA
ncbi:Gfo/Idh/MocA family protein [Paenibacillus hamazuiensis]|uniref:Gfo/Idh/MocA family protein n=1 Tax=Paenibacillus hamazuiensis TaxID=2936508 RepID=UPI00200C71C9|nr:Gfo/Idh/MocA family oxidoreductase [Paenibacillus hamazuiensis]